jgi:hypothetical protein
MFNLEALDKLIAVVVALLVLSLIVQSIQSAIKKFFRIKSLQLEQSLIHLFYYLLDKDAIKSMRSVSDRAPLIRAFFSFVRKFIPGHSEPLEARDPQVRARVTARQNDDRICLERRVDQIHRAGKGRGSDQTHPGSCTREYVEDQG